MRFDPRLWRGGPLAEDLGLIPIPSGEVRVCDAGTLFKPVRVAVPPGRYLARVLRDRSGDNVAASLVVGGREPVAWDEVGGYGVDAGMAGFFDGKLVEALDGHRWEASIYDDLISRYLDPAEREGRAGALVPFQDAAFSACRSGQGDGWYGVFVGRDAQGEVAVIVTGFNGDEESEDDDLSAEDEPTEVS